MSRAKTVTLLAPLSPPCFSSRDQWLEYLSHAAEYQRDGHAGPLMTRGEHTAFNFTFNFCRDCTALHRRDMVAADKCRPSHLIVLRKLALKPKAAA
jgi:hypothetical protein